MGNTTVDYSNPAFGHAGYFSHSEMQALKPVNYHLMLKLKPEKDPATTKPTPPPTAVTNTAEVETPNKKTRAKSRAKPVAP